MLPPANVMMGHRELSFWVDFVLLISEKAGELEKGALLILLCANGRISSKFKRIVPLKKVSWDICEGEIHPTIQPKSWA